MANDETNISRALAWAIAAIESLPQDLQPTDEAAEMRTVLKDRITKGFVSENTAHNWIADMARRILQAQTGNKTINR